jgi:hypothetical protein
MNINDGRWVFTSAATATNINYVDLDDEIHDAVKSGKLTWQTVANAVRAKRNNDPSFDWAQYDILRDRLNVRKAKFDLKGSETSRDVTGVGSTEQRGVNPSVSFVELNLVDKVGASSEDNTNVGGLSHPANPFDAAPPAPANVKPPKMKVNV